MRIAVIEHVDSSEYAEYIYSLIDEKAKEHNYYQKTWSNSVPAFQQQVEGDTIIYISIEKKSSWLLNWLYNVKIPSILKKTKAELVIDLNGVASTKIKIPQYIIAARFLFSNKANAEYNIEKFALKNFQSSYKVAAGCFAYVNNALKKQNFTQKKATYLPYTAPEIFRTYEWHDKLMIKANYAENKEYFLAVIGDNSVDDFVVLLQAFSKFKKWQQSNMLLLILPKKENFDAAIKEKYKTYKYRNDVKLLEDEDIGERQVAAIFASAYAFLHANMHEPNLFMIAVALQCSLPIITFSDNDVEQYAADAALYCNEKDAIAFGNTIVQLYKDEELHKRLQHEAQQQSELLKRNEYADKLWQIMHAAVPA